MILRMPLATLQYLIPVWPHKARRIHVPRTLIGFRSLVTLFSANERCGLERQVFCVAEGTWCGGRSAGDLETAPAAHSKMAAAVRREQLIRVEWTAPGKCRTLLFSHWSVHVFIKSTKLWSGFTGFSSCSTSFYWVLLPSRNASQPGVAVGLTGFLPGFLGFRRQVCGKHRRENVKAALVRRGKSFACSASARPVGGPASCGIEPDLFPLIAWNIYFFYNSFPLELAERESSSRCRTSRKFSEAPSCRCWRSRRFFGGKVSNSTIFDWNFLLLRNLATELASDFSVVGRLWPFFYSRLEFGIACLFTAALFFFWEYFFFKWRKSNADCSRKKWHPIRVGGRSSWPVSSLPWPPNWISPPTTPVSARKTQ